MFKIKDLSEKNQKPLKLSITQVHSDGGKVKIKDEGIVIPKKLFKEIVGTYIKMEQILATLETLADKETSLMF